MTYSTIWQLRTALYLAHMNPVTNAHVDIINELKEMADTVKVMPVVFRTNHEVNSKSFPFRYETRKKMLESIFADTISITDDYTFFAPFKKYLPPLLAPKSWELRKRILRNVEGDYFSYTGDKAEGYMLKLYRLKPKVGKRRQISATSIKENLYNMALGNDTDWKAGVPEVVADIIKKEWKVIEKFAPLDDATRRIAGMKFPKEGWSK